MNTSGTVLTPAVVLVSARVESSPSDVTVDSELLLKAEDVVEVEAVTEAGPKSEMRTPE